MATNRYSLADYIVTLTIPNNSVFPASIRGKSFSIGGAGIENGGRGSFLGQVTINRTANAWDTEGDHTGSWIHNKNNDKTGTVQIQVRQISDDVVRFAQICAAFESSQENTPGFGLQVTSAFSNDISGSNVVATCIDCYFQKLADIELGETAALQPWVITCGQVFEYEQ